MMNSSGTPTGVVASEEEDEEDGLDEDRMESADVVLVGAVRAAEEGMVIFEMGAGGGFSDATLRMELALETL